MTIQYSDELLAAMAEAEKRVLRLLALVGTVTLNWNSVEETLERLIWYYLGSNELGHIMTGKMHNLARCEALTSLAETREPIPEIKERLLNFVAVFDRLRLNRNAIVHSASFHIDRGGGALTLERLTKSIRAREYDTYKMPAEALERLSDQMVGLSEFGDTVLTIMQRRAGLMKQPFFAWQEPPPWPVILPMPEKLNSLTDPAPRAPKRPSQPLRG